MDSLIMAESCLQVRPGLAQYNTGATTEAIAHTIATPRSKEAKDKCPRDSRREHQHRKSTYLSPHQHGFATDTLVTKSGVRTILIKNLNKRVLDVANRPHELINIFF